jgi:hypothetical protein
MWLVVIALFSFGYAVEDLVMTPEETEYWNRFSNCRSACEVFCENIGAVDAAC